MNNIKIYFNIIKLYIIFVKKNRLICYLVIVQVVRHN